MFYNTQETGKRIAKIRWEMEMTQSEFAELLNITDRHLRRIEAGEKGASIEVLAAITVHSGKSLDFIVLGK